MKLYGIVAEYNPFHNGHRYHIEETRRRGATHIAVVMSGDFVQRGEPALLDKFTRASLAVKNGADLVIELPAAFSLSPAERFARGSVYLLKQLDCEGISFGSESGNAENLKELSALITGWNRSEELKELLASGLSYPAALQIIAEKERPDLAYIFSSPNDLLGVEYCRAAEFSDFSPEIMTIKREGAFHDGDTASDEYASASLIRKEILKGEDCSDYIPKSVQKAVRSAAKDLKLGSLSNLERVILARLRTLSSEEAELLPDAGDGLGGRLIAASGASLSHVLKELKVRRYPMARIKRILLSACIGIDKNDREVLPPYGRILAIGEKGREILKRAKDFSEIPFSTSPALLAKTSPEAERFSIIESRASDLYGLATEAIQPAGKDRRTKIALISPKEDL